MIQSYAQRRDGERFVAQSYDSSTRPCLCSQQIKVIALWKGPPARHCMMHACTLVGHSHPQIELPELIEPSVEDAIVPAGLEKSSNAHS